MKILLINISWDLLSEVVCDVIFWCLLFESKFLVVFVFMNTGELGSSTELVNSNELGGWGKESAELKREIASCAAACSA